jgi:hypothetical protein
MDIHSHYIQEVLRKSPTFLSLHIEYLMTWYTHCIQQFFYYCALVAVGTCLHSPYLASLLGEGLYIDAQKASYFISILLFFQNIKNRQCLGEHIPVAPNIHITTEELLDAVFSMWSMCICCSMNMFTEPLPKNGHLF